MFWKSKNTEEKIKEALVGFLTTKAPATQRQYKDIFDSWGESLSGIAWHKATEFNTQRYAKDQEQGGTVTKATVKRKLLVLSKFYSRLHAQGLCSLNPFLWAGDEYAKCKTGDVRPMKFIEFDMVPKICKAPPADKDGIRDRAMFSLLFGGALRIGEVAKLTIGDIRESTDGVEVHLARTKNGTTVNHNIQEEFTAAIIAYRVQRMREGAKQSDPLFVKYHGDGKPKVHGMDQRELRRSWDYWIDELKIPGAPSPHSARATAITCLLELLSQQGKLDYRSVRAFSRHSSVAMVEHYDLKREDAAKAMSEMLSYKKTRASRK